jgi:hypothetical protein
MCIEAILISFKTELHLPYLKVNINLLRLAMGNAVWSEFFMLNVRWKKIVLQSSAFEYVRFLLYGQGIQLSHSEESS